MGIISLHFTSTKTAKELGAFAKKSNRYHKKMKDHFEFDGGMSRIDSLRLNGFISEKDFESACSQWERGEHIESVFVKWAV
jgi:hypothetical protein